MRKLCVALVLAAWACGGPSDNPAGESKSSTQAQPRIASASTTTACEILTKADAEKALGRPAERLASTGGPAGLDICQYGYQGERMMDTGQATVTVQPVDIASLKKGVLDQGFHAEPVSGLGDEAFWSSEAGLYVGKGNRTAIYLIGVGGEDEAAGKQRAMELARMTVARL